VIEADKGNQYTMEITLVASAMNMGGTFLSGIFEFQRNIVRMLAAFFSKSLLRRSRYLFFLLPISFIILQLLLYSSLIDKNLKISEDSHSCENKVNQPSSLLFLRKTLEGHRQKKKLDERTDSIWRYRVEIFRSLGLLKKGRITNQNCALRYKNKSVELTSADVDRLSNSRYYFAINMHDNELVLSSFYPEFVETLKYLKKLTDGHQDSLYVSIYESGSTDLTSHFLESFSLVLENIGVQNTVITNQTDVRASGQKRINFLAKVRNKAMEPFYQKPANFYDYVIFLNDVYFCYEDIIRLLVYDADIACGLDFEFQDEVPVFRDVWVARDIQGERFLWHAPFSNHSETRSRIMNGQPFSAFCCWNGIAVINASIFNQGIIFREANYTAGECSASECSLLCNDIWKQNERAHIVVDPHVRFSYRSEIYEDLNNMYWVTPEIAANLSPNVVERNITFFERPVNWSCCPIMNDEDQVSFDQCFSERIFPATAENATETLLNSAASSIAAQTTELLSSSSSTNETEANNTTQAELNAT